MKTKKIAQKSSSKPITTFLSVKAIKEARTITNSEAVLLKRVALIRKDLIC